MDTHDLEIIIDALNISSSVKVYGDGREEHQRTIAAVIERLTTGAPTPYRELEAELHRNADSHGLPREDYSIDLDGPGMWAVGRVDRQPLPNGERITEWWDTHDLAAAFIDHLPDHEKGIYFLDGPCYMKPGDQYVKESGCCPRCDSDQIEGVDNFDPEAQGMTIECKSCGLEYHDAYTLTGYYIVNGAGVDEYNATPLGRPITDAQRDTILAALRLWTAVIDESVTIHERRNPMPVGWADRTDDLKAIATNGGIHPALTPNQIDELCEQLNITGGTICSVCGNCSESLDDNDLCNDCAREGA